MTIAVWLRNQRWLVQEDLMATVEQFVAAIEAINVATNALADEVARLRALIAAGGLSPEQEASILADLGVIEARLKAIGSEPVA